MNNYFGTLSPPSSTGDSSEAVMCSPGSQFSHGQIIYNVTEATILEDNAISNQFLPHLEIIEQPTDKFRFRYKSEMTGTHGTLTGQSTDRIRKNTYPTVQLKNYSGPAMIRCALYQIDNLNTHPHRLVSRDSKDHEKDDPHEMWISEENNYIAQFSGMGIIHTAKKNHQNELYNKLKKIAVDELLQNGENRSLTRQEDAMLKETSFAESKNVNLNKVRLGFEAFRVENHKYVKICEPVFSQGINNLKSAETGELRIVRMDFITASCKGGQEIFMLVEKVVKDNISIRFFEVDKNDKEIWEAYGKFNQSDVHHQYAIVFKAPPYKNQDIEDTVSVLVELVRPKDGARSDSKPFKYKPCDRLGRKRPRINQSESLSSSELPLVINNLSVKNLSLNESETFDSNFLDKLENVDSAPFNSFCNEFLNDYIELCDINTELALEPNAFNRIDGPVKATTTSEPSTSNVSNKTRTLSKTIVQHLRTLIKNNEEPKKMELYIMELFNNRINKTDEGNNALHTSIICEQYEALQYILVLLSKMLHLNIPNIKNNDGNTAQHLAVNLQDNVEKVISVLLQVGANPTLVNNNGNTPLHLAVENNKLVHCKELITPSMVVKDNDVGDTPLFMAVQKSNLAYLKLLMACKPNVNATHIKSGNTCLHFAVEQESLRIVLYLLSLPEIRIDIENYKGFTPIAYAKALEHTAIYEKLNNYVLEKGLDIKVKMEEEYYSSEDEVEVKEEPESENDKMEIENPVIEFPNKLINILAKELDGSEALRKLIVDLEYPLIEGPISAKMILNYANCSQIPVLRIRDLLENYGATDCVKLIDKFQSPK